MHLDSREICGQYETGITRLRRVRFVEKVSFKLRAKFSFRECKWQRGGTIISKRLGSVSKGFHGGW